LRYSQIASLPNPLSTRGERESAQNFISLTPSPFTNGEGAGGEAISEDSDLTVKIKIALEGSWMVLYTIQF
jgi:hypothetical protein